MTYYNKPTVKQTLLDREVAEIDVVSYLMPPNYIVAAGYVFTGTYLIGMAGTTPLFRSFGQILQLMGVATFLRKISRLSDTPNSGKGI